MLVNDQQKTVILPLFFTIFVGRERQKNYCKWQPRSKCNQLWPWSCRCRWKCIVQCKFSPDVLQCHWRSLFLCFLASSYSRKRQWLPLELCSIISQCPCRFHCQIICILQCKFCPDAFTLPCRLHFRCPRHLHLHWCGCCPCLCHRQVCARPNFYL